MLGLVAPLTLSGYATYNDWGDVWGGDWLEDVHAFFADALLAVVLLHLALIAGFSLLRRLIPTGALSATALPEDEDDD